MKRLLICLMLLAPVSALGADGDFIGSQNTTSRVRHIKFLDAKVAVADGVWIDVIEYETVNIHVSGVTTATIQVHGDSSATIPSNPTDGVVMATLTANGIVAIPKSDLPRYVKVKISAWTAGTISALGVLKPTDTR